MAETHNKPGSHPAPSAPVATEEKPQAAPVVVGSLDVGYNLLIQADAFNRESAMPDDAKPAKPVAQPTRKEAQAAIAAAQAWTVPTPHKQDVRYTLAGRAALLTNLSNLFNSLPEEKGK